MNGVWVSSVALWWQFPLLLPEPAAGRQLCCRDCALSLAFGAVISQGMLLTLLWGLGLDYDGKSGVETVMTHEGVFEVCSPNTGYEWAGLWLHTLYTRCSVISDDTVTAGVITTCRGKVVSDTQKLPNSTAGTAGPCSGMFLGRNRKLEQAHAYVCSVYEQIGWMMDSVSKIK